MKGKISLLFLFYLNETELEHASKDVIDMYCEIKTMWVHLWTLRLLKKIIKWKNGMEAFSGKYEPCCVCQLNWAGRKGKQTAKRTFGSDKSKNKSSPSNHSYHIWHVHFRESYLIIWSELSLKTQWMELDLCFLLCSGLSFH